MAHRHTQIKDAVFASSCVPPPPVGLPRRLLAAVAAIVGTRARGKAAATVLALLKARLAPFHRPPRGTTHACRRSLSITASRAPPRALGAPDSTHRFQMVDLGPGPATIPAALPSALSAVAHTVLTSASARAPDQWGIYSTWCTNISSNAQHTNHDPGVNIFACARTLV